MVTPPWAKNIKTETRNFFKHRTKRGPKEEKP